MLSLLFVQENPLRFLPWVLVLLPASLDSYTMKHIIEGGRYACIQEEVFVVRS
jgi:hypothetical protein